MCLKKPVTELLVHNYIILFHQVLAELERQEAQSLSKKDESVSPSGNASQQEQYDVTEENETTMKEGRSIKNTVHK